MTGIVALAILAVLAERGYRTLRRPKLSFDQWRQQLKARKTTSIDLAEVKPIEHILAGPDRRQTQLHKFKLAAPLLVLFAGIFVWLGFHQSIKLARLESTGLRTAGEVVRLQDEDSDGSRVYHAVVRFRTEKNVPVEFKDSVGSNPPRYRPGDKVAVLYLADNPREAMIDRGVFNWAIPALLFLVAACVIWLLVVMLRGAAPPKTAIPDPTAAAP
jgi:hypothetical protein